MTAKPAIVWFRQDLRLRDNPALSAAVDAGAPVIPLFILDDAAAGEWAPGAASRWWLHHSLQSLNESLDQNMVILRGSALPLLTDLVRQTEASAVFWNRCYEPWRRERDRDVKDALQNMGTQVRTFNGSLLFEPTSVCKSDGTPYKVFTPYYKKGCLENAPPVRALLPAPQPISFFSQQPRGNIEDLDLLPRLDWASQFSTTWLPGEAGAHAKLERFLIEGIKDYKNGRNRPDQEYVSRLSPHLHFGEISPHQAWHATSGLLKKAALAENVAHFRSELGWREFSYYLLYHFPDLVDTNMQRKFDRFPWQDDEQLLRLWQKGATGYPIVDAGMRQLWQSGYMHNRVRMIVGSFLIKNLLIHWIHGARWFWDTLLDADLANNSASWQWVAGSGADAAPYFRIFNPVTQGRKFDPEGDYVRQYVPEIARLDTRFLHAPWEAPAEELQRAGVSLGSDYPHPVIDLGESRKRALESYQTLSSGHK